MYNGHAAPGYNPRNQVFDEGYGVSPEVAANDPLLVPHIPGDTVAPKYPPEQQPRYQQQHQQGYSIDFLRQLIQQEQANLVGHAPAPIAAPNPSPSSNDLQSLMLLISELVQQKTDSQRVKNGHSLVGLGSASSPQIARQRAVVDLEINLKLNLTLNVNPVQEAA